jgi:RHS repeat-associated protein
MRINGDKYQYHTDHQGTPRWVTNAQGSIVWSADYAAFGAATENIRRIRQPIRFPGHYFDEETGLHYNRARYYAPSLGRYLSRDPLEFFDGINFYVYAGNDPINDCDPLGLLSFWKKVAVAAAVTAGVALMVVAVPVVIAGAAAVATGAAVAAGTAGMVGMFVGGAALVGTGVGLATTSEDQSAGNQALHVLKYGLFGAAGGASAVLTVFGAAGMAGMAMGGGGGAMLCAATGKTIVSTSAAPLIAAGGTLGMAATTQMAMSQAGEGGGGGGGEQDGGKGQKGKTFRGGKKKGRDNWYGYNDKDFQRWWHRQGKREFGGQDIENAEEAKAAYEHWVSIGKPTVK